MDTAYSIIPFPDAISVQRPESEPWCWPPHIYAMISNCIEFFPVGSGTFPLEVALNFTESLYKAGYVIAKKEQA